VAEFRLAPRTERDLEEIWRYTAEQWSFEQTERYLDNPIAAMTALADAPSRGRSAEHIRPGYRRRNTGAHVIFYRPASHGITVVRILHQRMDFDSHFDSD
jgi:toxin ParE1/3/4